MRQRFPEGPGRIVGHVRRMCSGRQLILRCCPCWLMGLDCVALFSHVLINPVDLRPQALTSACRSTQSGL